MIPPSGTIVFWVVALIVFVIVEAVTAGLISIWFVFGALVALICAALGAAVCLAWVFADFTGYQANMTEFSDSVKKGVFFSYTVIPGITSALAAIPIFFYDLVGDKKKQISADLAARRGVVE